ncbi:MAG: alpha/beta hydrolase [Shinella sp.]|nr:alpha/beta hydrolase [Shinella sp.]
MFSETLRLATPTGANLAYHRQPGAEPAGGILIVSHGLSEHSRRYRRFAEALAASGMHVYAHDHRGHGETTAPDAPLGRFAAIKGPDAVIADMLAMRDLACGRHPGLPVVVFGHSMGGLFSLAFAEKHPDRLDGLAVWNSNLNPGLAGRAAQAILAAERMRMGSDVPSGLLPRLTFGAWAKTVKNRRSDFDWLSQDPAEVGDYVADPLCGFYATVSLWVDLFAVTFAGANRANLARLPRHLPVHLVGGGQDPATDFGRAVTWLGEKLRQNGLADVTTTIYPDARHETLNEVERIRQEATGNFTDWCRRVTRRYQESRKTA